jgi:hypothetical protein
MEFLGSPAHGRTVVAVVDFLSDDAPFEKLVVGAQFELVRGDTVVARGIITVDQTTNVERDAPKDCSAGPIRTEQAA